MPLFNKKLELSSDSPLNRPFTAFTAYGHSLVSVQFYEKFLRREILLVMAKFDEKCPRSDRELISNDFTFNFLTPKRSFRNLFNIFF